MATVLKSVYCCLDCEDVNVRLFDRSNLLVVSGVCCLVDGQVSSDAGQVGVGSVVQQKLDAGSVS